MLIKPYAIFINFGSLNFIQNRQAFWQDKVGKSANSIAYTMKTRWGSCSTQAKTLSVFGACRIMFGWLCQFNPAETDTNIGGLCVGFA